MCLSIFVVLNCIKCVCPLQVGGLSAVIIGICAWLDNEHHDLMSQLPILPALLLISVGAAGSFIGFIGLLGAVRESFCLLKMVKIFSNLLTVLLISCNAFHSIIVFLVARVWY